MKVAKRRKLKKYAVFAFLVTCFILLLLWLISFYIDKKVTSARDALLSVVSYATICVDDGFLLGDAVDDDELFSPVSGERLCQDAEVTWPDLPYGWKYLPSSKASVFRATFEYSAEGNDVRIRCTEAGCEEFF